MSNEDKPGIDGQEFTIVIEEIWDDERTLTDFLYNRSDRLSQEEFKDIMIKEYDKVKENPLYFFKNYFKTKWNEIKPNDTLGGK